MEKNRIEEELMRILDHLKGEGEEGGGGPIAVDTYGGQIRVEWDAEQNVTAVGQIPFFIEFLKAAGSFDEWVKECPLERTSPNAPSNVNVLGTYLLSALSGQKRYAHITAIRGDGVTPGLLGMTKVMSEDAARRAFEKADGEKMAQWQREHLLKTYEPLLQVPYILDVDSSVKPLYGKQEGAVVGYNPHKPGRPAHTFHTYFIANLRLVMDSEVQAGNQTAAKYSMPGLWKLIDGLAVEARPWLLRGDCAFGNEGVLVECESRKVPYLFKLRQTVNVKKLVQLVKSSRDWSDAGQGWEGVEGSLKLDGWSNQRRVVVLRRKLKEERKRPHGNTRDQPFLPFQDVIPEAKHYEYAVLVTSLAEEVRAIAQLYRDRADSENNFDEIFNQWGWGGFVTQDLKRCQITARIVAQVFNWWTIFARLAVPNKHLEAITSRPLMLNAIGRQTVHSGQKTLKVTSTHAKAASIQVALSAISNFFGRIKRYAEQFTRQQKWGLILRAAFRAFLKDNYLNTRRLLPSYPP